jgi:hypothetical protein
MKIVYRNVRLNEKVDRCLRRSWKKHGDLSICVCAALDQVNLRDVKLLDMDCSRVHAMHGWRIRVCVADLVNNSARGTGCRGVFRIGEILQPPGCLDDGGSGG